MTHKLSNSEIIITETILGEQKSKLVQVPKQVIRAIKVNGELIYSEQMPINVYRKRTSPLDDFYNWLLLEEKRKNQIKRDTMELKVKIKIDKRNCVWTDIKIKNATKSYLESQPYTDILNLLQETEYKINALMKKYHE
ncbi:hypothetical protein [Ornithobacterium rhinotracheale]|uniref:hypothetical protein n=1 Tax=Ornithobacterium rhinotracheale TaxID=28251 RepID=UPI0040365D35